MATAQAQIHLSELSLPERLRRGYAETDLAETILEGEFEREALGAERLRLRVLLIVIGAGAALSLISPAHFMDGVERIFRGGLSSFVQWRFIILGGLLLYLLCERVLLGQLRRRRMKIPVSYRYLSALVETSFPTAEVLLAASYMEPGSPLTTIPAFAYSLFIVLSALRLNFRLCVFTGAVAALEYALVGALYVEGAAGQGLASGPVHVVVGLVLLSLGVVTGLVALQIKSRILGSFRLAEERNRIVSTFGRHVSPVVVDKLLEQGADLRGEKRNVCVMFLDIRNFTGFAETRSPEEVVDYLESLFGFMIEIVNRHQGIINKFLGDGFMAVFGAPVSDGDDCANALRAAREILARVEEEVSAGRVLPTSVGIGLHAGDAVTGSIGSQLRKEYTVIGDVVNLASRIEQLNKQFGTRLLISETVRDSVGEREAGASLIGRVQVKGREAPVLVYRVA